MLRSWKEHVPSWVKVVNQGLASSRKPSMIHVTTRRRKETIGISLTFVPNSSQIMSSKGSSGVSAAGSGVQEELTTTNGHQLGQGLSVGKTRARWKLF